MPNPARPHALSLSSLSQQATRTTTRPRSAGGAALRAAFVVVVAVDATSQAEPTKTSHGEPSKSSQGKDQDGDKDGLA